jgi:hypothetical protein
MWREKNWLHSFVRMNEMAVRVPPIGPDHLAGFVCKLYCDPHVGPRNPPCARLIGSKGPRQEVASDSVGYDDSAAVEAT